MCDFLRIVFSFSKWPLGMLFLIAVPWQIFTQTPYPDPDLWKVEQMSISDQIGSPSIYSIAEDTSGYLWFASNSGIVKYDGYNYKVYPAIPGDSTSLNHSRASFVYTDQKGQLWVGTRIGINRYLPKCDCFKQYNPVDKASNSIPLGEVNWMAESKNGQLWVVTQQGGLYRYIQEKDNFERFLFRQEDSVNLSNDQLRVVMCDRDGWIWVGTGEPFVNTIIGGGLIRFNPKNWRSPTVPCMRQKIHLVC